MKSLPYKRAYKSREYLATLGAIEYRSLFGGYSLTVDNTAFVMVSDGKLHLRVYEQSVQYCVKHPPVWLTYKKCGRSATLSYYRAGESPQRSQLKLARLSRYSLNATLKEKSTHNTRERLKNSSNMSFHLGAILGEVGIKDVRALCTPGAKMYRLRLWWQNSLVTEKILSMLEDAIIDIREAALPVAHRQELAEWADLLTPEQEFPAGLGQSGVAGDQSQAVM